MFSIVVCMKINDSYERLKSLNKKDGVEWEEYIDKIEELQEKVAYKEYDLAVVDTKLWWAEEAIDLLRIKNVEVIEFNGDFFETLKKLEKLIPDVVDTDEADEDNSVLNVRKESQPKVIIQEKVIVKEKVVYKSKNIKQTLSTFITTDDPVMRDFVVCNVAAILGREEKTIVVDMTNTKNIKLYLKIIKKHKSESPFKEELNGGNLTNYIDQYEYFDLLQVEQNDITKGNIKKFMFAARDYENIIFVTEPKIDDLSVNFILNCTHKIYLISEPLYLSAKNNMKLISDITEKGQLEENITLIISENEELDNDTIECLYTGIKYYVLDRDNFLNNINEQVLADNKMMIIFNKMLGIKNKRTLLEKIFRKGNTNA